MAEKVLTKRERKGKRMSSPPTCPRHKIASAPLSQDLRIMYSVKSLPVRKGDTVKVVRGDFTGIEGKVTEVNANNGRIYLEGVTREKVSGATTKVSVHASKVVIKNLNLDDKWRSEKLKKKQRSAELSEAAVREEQK